jgi:hypothetical protein
MAKAGRARARPAGQSGGSPVITIRYVRGAHTDPRSIAFESRRIARWGLTLRLSSRWSLRSTPSADRAGAAPSMDGGRSGPARRARTSPNSGTVSENPATVQPIHRSTAWMTAPQSRIGRSRAFTLIDSGDSVPEPSPASPKRVDTLPLFSDRAADRRRVDGRPSIDVFVDAQSCAVPTVRALATISSAVLSPIVRMSRRSATFILAMASTVP